MVAKPEIASEKNSKTVFRCVVEPHESTRQRAESSQSKNHEDHIAGKGFTSMSHCNLVRKFFPMPQAMKIPDAKAAVDKEWEKVQSIKEVIMEAQRDKKESPLCCTDGRLSPQKCGVGAKITAVQRQSRAPARHCKRRLWILCSFY